MRTDLKSFQASGDIRNQPVQGQPSAYGVLRTRDSVVSIAAVNKTYGDLTSALPLGGLRSIGPASVFVYPNADLSAIMAQSGWSLTLRRREARPGIISTTFPVQSITLLAVPQL